LSKTAIKKVLWLSWVRGYYITNLKNNTSVWIKQILFQNLKIAREPNLHLASGKLVWPAFANASASQRGELKNGDGWPKNPWAMLCVARENFVQNPNCFNVVCFYNEIRTVFEKN